MKRDTAPEVRLRSVLHRVGLRFRKHYRIPLPSRRSIEGDIVFPRQRVVLLVDGCFWHQCPEHSNVPRANTSYWVPKLQRNVERDRAVDVALNEAGWTVVRVWEHQDPNEAAAHVVQVVRSRGGDVQGATAGKSERAQSSSH